jgi:PhzF family phenazine biosynthesis protein
MEPAMTSPTLSKLAAFTRDPAGGNPAGVWIGDELPDAATMQRIAAEVGFSETAFVAPATGTRRTVRYYSPEAEVAFCGHATIATGVLLGDRDGDGLYQLSTTVGDVPVMVRTVDGEREAALTSVVPRHHLASDTLVDAALRALRWSREDLDRSIPPARAFAGVWHLVLAVKTTKRLQDLDYDFATLKALMLEDGLTTLQIVHRVDSHTFESRNPFPVGGVVEDPATGAGAAALGGYLRDAGLLTAPATIVIHQGVAMGRPSRITVDIPAEGGIIVRGPAATLGD